MKIYNDYDLIRDYNIRKQYYKPKSLFRIKSILLEQRSVGRYRSLCFKKIYLDLSVFRTDKFIYRESSIDISHMHNLPEYDRRVLENVLNSIKRDYGSYVQGITIHMMNHYIKKHRRKFIA